MTKNISKTATEEEKLAKSASLDALKAQLAGQLVGHHFGPPADPNDYDKATNIVTASNGIFRVIKTPIAIFKTQLSKMEKKDATIPGLPEMKAGIELLIPKIPFKYWLQVFNWYKDVDKKDGTEASVLFFWNHNNEPLPETYTDNTPVKGLVEDEQLIIYCPRQKNSSGLSEFGHDGVVQYLRENTTPLLETHSHNTMGAFFSGTDDANENMTQFYAVYGKIKDDEPAFIFRFVSGDQKIQCSGNVLFDFPKIKETTTVTREFDIEGVDAQATEEVKEIDYKGPWPVIDYPADWMEQHTKSTTTYSKGKGYNQGSYKNYPPEDDYDYYDTYGMGHYYPGFAAGSSKKPYTTPARQEEDLKKNASAGADTEIVESDRSETKVDVMAMDIVNTFSNQEVKELIEELCDFGYDYILLDIMKESSDTALLADFGYNL